MQCAHTFGTIHLNISPPTAAWHRHSHITSARYLLHLQPLETSVLTHSRCWLFAALGVDRNSVDGACCCAVTACAAGRLSAADLRRMVGSICEKCSDTRTNTPADSRTTNPINSWNRALIPPLPISSRSFAGQLDSIRRFATLANGGS